MGYSTTVRQTLNTYAASDNVLIDDSAVDSTASKGVYVKLKEIKLNSDIEASSLFRFKFDLRCPIADGYARIYRNGVAVGSIQTVSGTGAAYVTKTEDIITTNWVIGDLIQLYAMYDGFGVDTCYVKDFQICGTPSEWVIM